jgi:hypothetical protein
MVSRSARSNWVDPTNMKRIARVLPSISKDAGRAMLNASMPMGCQTPYRLMTARSSSHRMGNGNCAELFDIPCAMPEHRCPRITATPIFRSRSLS